MAMTWLYGDLPQFSLFLCSLLWQIKSLQVAGELTLSQAIVSSQIPPHLINRRNTLHCNRICYFFIKSATVHVKVKLLTWHGRI